MWDIFIVHRTCHLTHSFYARFRCPGSGRSIQDFKFKQAGGRVELIKGIAGGDQNRRKYYSGWCQFIKLAKAFNGYVIKFPNSQQGVEVDVIGYKTKDGTLTA